VVGGVARSSGILVGGHNVVDIGALVKGPGSVLEDLAFLDPCEKDGR
jgi:hypothetical protein